jgi:uncharacterized protein
MLLNWANRRNSCENSGFDEPGLVNGFVADGSGPPSSGPIHIPADVIPEFHQRPPWLGADLQTLRNFFRGALPDLEGGERLLLRMPDGDRLAARLDRPATSAAKPVVVLVHGLAGSETSKNVVATSRHLVQNAWPVLRLNLRGSLPSRPTSAGRYHAGRTEDLAEALRELPPDLTRHGIVLVGHSLGGSLVLKFLGEGGHDLPVLAAVVVSVPLDFAATCARMMERRNYVYHSYMLDAIKREALAPGAALNAAERAVIASARNVFEFDELFVAPHFGYRDAMDYYKHNEAKRFIPGVGRPTLILHALDDPWIPAECYRAVDWSRLPMIETALTPRGGHLGFHGRGSRVAWHDRVTAQWLSKLLDGAP